MYLIRYISDAWPTSSLRCCGSEYVNSAIFSQFRLGPTATALRSLAARSPLHSLTRRPLAASLTRRVAIRSVTRSPPQMSGDRIDDADATNTTTPWFPSKAAYATLHDWLTYTEARYRVLPVIHVSQALQKEAMDVMLDMCLLGDARHGNGWVGSETDSKNEIRWQSQPATSSVATSLALCRPKGCVTCSPVRDNGDPQVNMYKIASRSDTAIIGPPNVVSGVYVEAIGDHERAHAAAHCKDLRFAAFSMDNRLGIYGVNPGGSLDGNSTTMGTMARLNGLVTTQSPEEKEAR